MKTVGIGCVLLAMLSMVPVLAGAGTPVRKAQSARPRLAFNSILHVLVQCGAVEQLTLFDPGGNRAFVSADTSLSDIRDCIGKTLVYEAADTLGGMPGGWYFEAQRPEVGAWRLEVALPRSAPAPSDVLIDAMVISRGTHRNLCNGLTLEPGQKGTWQLRVLPTGDIQDARPLRSAVPIDERRKR